MSVEITVTSLKTNTKNGVDPTNGATCLLGSITLDKLMIDETQLYELLTMLKERGAVVVTFVEAPEAAQSEGFSGTG